MNDLSHNINVSLVVKNRIEREEGFDFGAEVERVNKAYGIDPNANLKHSIECAKRMLREKNLPISLLWLED